MNNYVLIVAGGRGSRMNLTVPKQFVEIHGIPMLMHTFFAFQKSEIDARFILVLPEDEIEFWKDLCRRHHFDISHDIVRGGDTRFQSVKNGLSEIDSDGIVFIHDGVRPLVSVDTIRNCYDMALERGNALPVIAASESIREQVTDGSRAVDRSRYFLVQTPQTFQISIIKQAYNKCYSDRFTDDASVLESDGGTIHLVAGNIENIKVTWPVDLALAEILLK